MRTYNITLGDSDRFLVIYRVYETTLSFRVGTFTVEQARKLKQEYTELGYIVSILKLN